jgi:hypothetical protein
MAQDKPITALYIETIRPNAIYVTLVTVAPAKADDGETTEGVVLWQSERALCLN